MSEVGHIDFGIIDIERPKLEDDSLDTIYRDAHEFMSQLHNGLYLYDMELHDTMNELLDRTVAVMERDR